MNISMIARLVLKDWYLNRFAIILVIFGIILGVALSAVPGNRVPMMGLNLILSMFIALTFYLPLSTVLNERTKKTLPFILSLPVSLTDYTTAKILANTLLYAVPLAGVAFASRLVFESELELSLGLGAYHIPVLLLGLLVIFSLVLSFCLITESMGWTVALIVITMFLVGNVFTQLVPQIPAVGEFLGAIAFGKVEFFLAMGVELGILFLLLLTTYGVQSSKRNFL